MEKAKKITLSEKSQTWLHLGKIIKEFKVKQKCTVI